MAAVLTGVIVAVVAGFFGLGGAAVAARREHDRWLRQARLDAYADFLGRATEMTISFVLRDSLVTKDNQSPAATNDAQFKALDAMEQAAARVTLVAPTEVVDLCVLVYALVAEISMHGNNEARPDYNRARDAFITVASNSILGPRGRPVRRDNAAASAVAADDEPELG